MSEENRQPSDDGNIIQRMNRAESTGSSADKPVNYDIVPDGALPDGEALKRNVSTRRSVGNVWRIGFLSSLVIGIVTLIMLLYNVADSSFGLIAVEARVSDSELLEGTGKTALEQLSDQELRDLIRNNLSAGALRRAERALKEETGNPDITIDTADATTLISLVQREVQRREVVESWGLTRSLTDRSGIEAQLKEEFPDAQLEWTSWLTPRFLVTPMSSTPALAGVRTALLGSLWMIVLTMLFAFPIGVGAAIYLEEYATDNWLNNIIKTNINNLAGVPSIIYGMLGLAIFVRGILSGATGGRTLISASMTMALLILPLIIINAQEAIRAVPRSLHQASYGLGATRWQTIWNQVLPVAFPGILTGTILAMSRAIGETAPLIVVGASTFIVTDPTGPFSQFTALPIQIYNWTSRPQAEFRNIAAAAIIVLLIVLLSLNSLAIYLRNRYRRTI